MHLNDRVRFISGSGEMWFQALFSL